MNSKVIGELEFCAIDFESAGTARGKTDAPVQVGMVTWSLKGGVLDQWESYIHTDRDITWSAQKVHGISKEDLRGAPKMMMMWPEFKKRLESRPVVAHSCGTEKRFLRAFPAHGFGPWVDTLQLARAAWPDLLDHSLGGICEALGLSVRVAELVEGRDWHDALFDATGSIVLLEKLIVDFGIAERSLDHLEDPDISRWYRMRR